MKNLFEKAVDIVLYLSFVALFKILSKISTVLTIIPRLQYHIGRFELEYDMMWMKATFDEVLQN